ncbi:MAG: glycosyltransferase family 9 protein [Blastocatellia bacterium]
MSQMPRAILAIDTTPFARSLTLLAVIRALRIALPQTFIAVAATTATSQLLTAAGLTDEAIDLGVIKSLHGGDGLKRLARLFKRARHRDYDLVLDFSPKIDTQVLSRFVLNARTVMPARWPRVIDLLMGGSRRGVGAGGYESVLRQIGIELRDERLGLFVPADEHAQFEKLLERSGSRGGEPLVALYTADANGGASWPVSAFGEIGQRLTNAFGARVVALDEPGDAGFTAAVNGLLPKSAIKLATPRALQLAAAIARASLVITDAAGVAQMANDLGTPVIEITEDSGASRPTPIPHHVICAPSPTRITTDEVYEPACALIQSSRSAQLFRD